MRYVNYAKKTKLGLYALVSFLFVIDIVLIINVYGNTS